jgi:NADH-quinone oxidoreductase subunit J
VELFLLSLFLIPALTVVGIGALHTTIWLVVVGSATVFYLFLPLAANLLAVAVVFLRNPMQSLLALIGVFVNAAAVFFTAGAEFLGLVFLIVYVGAVAILFLFVIMLLNVKSLTAGFSLLQHLLQKASFAAAPALAAVLPSRLVPGFYIQTLRATPLSGVQESTTTEALLYYVNYVAADVMSIATLYTDQVALFLLITCVLLVAMLGAIVLATVTLEEDEPLAPNYSYQAPVSPSTIKRYSSRPITPGCRGHHTPVTSSTMNKISTLKTTHLILTSLTTFTSHLFQNFQTTPTTKFFPLAIVIAVVLANFGYSDLDAEVATGALCLAAVTSPRVVAPSMTTSAVAFVRR